MRLNKVSGLRYKEEAERGFDIVTGDKLEGPAVTYKQNQVSNSGPVKAWNQALSNANGNDRIDELKAKLQEEEYYKKLKERGVNAEFKASEL